MPPTSIDTLHELRSAHARVSEATRAAQETAAAALVHVRRLEDELLRAGYSESEIATAREGGIVQLQLHRHAPSALTAADFLAQYGERKLITVLALFTRGHTDANVARLFGASRRMVRAWRQALVMEETRWPPHPDVASLAAEPDLQVVA